MPFTAAAKAKNWEQQKRALTCGADIIIATPGRLIAHLQMGYVKFDQIKYLVLDEADKMMDMGFSDDILNIVRQLPKQRQTLLFSATMPNKIRDFSQQILNEPEEIRLAVSKPAAGIDQQLYMAFDRQKIYILEHIHQNPGRAEHGAVYLARKQPWAASCAPSTSSATRPRASAPTAPRKSARKSCAPSKTSSSLFW